MDVEDGGDAGDGHDCLGVGYEKGGFLHFEKV
jgi:hypothetical protein